MFATYNAKSEQNTQEQEQRNKQSATTEPANAAPAPSLKLC